MLAWDPNLRSNTAIRIADKKVFVFFTATLLVKSMHQPLNEILVDKGFVIVGEFHCKGFMTYSFTKYIFGGLNKGRPNEQDYKNAMHFAESLKATINEQT